MEGVVFQIDLVEGAFKPFQRHFALLGFQLAFPQDDGVPTEEAELDYDARCIRRRKAMAMLRRAKSFTETNVVRCFSTLNGMTSNSLARHSSAKELDTMLTPSKRQFKLYSYNLTLQSVFHRASDSPS